ncbi:MAG: tetratricopeptide repeat protein [candidate division KSB1 bacterium]|nr:tetratricopeptide repeat protein [candidate division KSB1 bacterium]
MMARNKILHGLIGLSLILMVWFGAANHPVQAQTQQKLQQIYRMATDFERMGYYDRAVEQYKLLFSWQPHNTTYYRGLKRNLERLGKYEEMANIIRRRMAVVDDALGRSDLGSALYKLGRIDDARQVWRQTLRKFAKNSGAYAQVAAAMISNQLFDDAIEVYKQARRAFGSDVMFAIELANAYAARSQYERATEEFIRYLERNPRQLPYIQRRILQFFDETDSLKILRTLEAAAKKQQPPPVPLLKLQAECLKRIGRFAEALEIYRSIEERRSPKERNRGNELYNFASEANRAGQTEIAIRAYRLLIQHWPDTPYIHSARMGLADAYLKAGEPEAAIRVLDDILQKPGQRVFKFRALLKKGDIYLQELNRPTDAIEVFEAIFNTYPDLQARRGAAISLGDSYLKLDRLDKAREWYEEAYKLTRTQDQALRNRILFKQAKLAFFENRFSEAMTLLENIQPLTTGAARMATEDLVNDALDWIFFIEQALPDSAGALPLYAKAEKFKTQERFARAASALQKLIETYPNSTIAPKALLDLGDIQGRLQQTEAQIETYQRLLENYPSSIYVDAAQFSLAVALETAGRTTQAIEHYEKLLVDFPESIYLEEARQRLRALQAKSGRVF